MTMMKLFPTLTTSGILACSVALPVTAQVIPDGTTSTTVDVDGTINDGDRAGGNLFHSFQEFSVPDGGRAFFNNALDIVNIFSRVTGGDISNINGLLGANGTANLFLLNPAGIIFGENAQLSIGGSFFGSTADSIIFSDGEFSALDADNPPLLTVNAPLGLGIRDNPADIVNQSTFDGVGLQVPSGETLALIGGDINFEAGNMTARGGNIELGGLSAAGTVTFNDDGSLSFPEDVAKTDITLSNAADIDVRGTGGGSITISARNLNLESGDFGSSFIRAGITADSTSSEAQAGEIKINATNNVTADESSILNQVDSEAVGNAGGVTITTGSLTLINGGEVSAITRGQGNAGSVEITARDTITIDGERSDFNPSRVGSLVAPTGKGNAGSVKITTDNLVLTNGGIVSVNTFGQGNAGSVEITARDTITIDGEQDSFVFPSGVFNRVVSGAKGNAGSITIITDNLTLTNGGEVSASTGGQGNAGAVEITARDTITIDGEDSSSSPSAVNSEVISGAVGNARDVTINTGSLNLTNGGEVAANTRGQGDAGSVKISATDTITIDGERSNNFPSSVSTQVGQDAVGDAGSVTITTNNLTLTNGGIVSASTSAQGNAGLVVITARDTITIDGEQDSFVFPSGVFNQVVFGAKGNAGSVTITTGNLTLTNGGQVSASTSAQGNAGSVEITARDTITIDGEDSSSSPSAVNSQVISGAVGNAGDVTITTGNFTLTNGGTVNTNTFGQGNAGSVEITARDTIIIDGESIAGSQVSSGAVGNAGDVTITTGSLNLTNGGQINTSTNGIGKGGQITVSANSISLSENSGVGSVTFFNSEDIDAEQVIGGDIELNVSESLIITGNSSIASGTLGKGDAGNINISGEGAAIFLGDNVPTGEENAESSGSILTSSIDISPSLDSTGNAGDITITAKSLTLREGSLVNSSAFGQGNSVTVSNSGNISIDVSEGVTISGFDQNTTIVSRVATSLGTGVEGSAGDITITAGSLSLEDSGFIDSSTSGQGNTGDITIDVTDAVTLSSNANIRSRVQSSGNGNGGQIIITANSLFLKEGAEILTETFGQGNAGNIIVNANDSVNISGVAPFPRLENGNPGGFSSGLIAGTEEGALGEGGEITVNTPKLTLSDGGIIDARSRSDFAGGNITVNADNLEITGGGQIQAAAFSNGSAGNINLNINNQITIDGSDPTFQERFNSLVTTFDETEAEERIDPVSPESGIFANTRSGSSGDGGNITIGIFDSEGAFNTNQFTQEITLSNQGTIAADSEGAGSGGIITIRAEDINLDAGEITATTTTLQEGVNPSLSAISLLVDDNLILRNNSEISAEATNNADGGNINIDAGFVIGFPSRGFGSDIRANAGEGRGGNINIITQGVLGFEESQNTANVVNNTNDIDASSEFGLDGIVTISFPDVNPLQGLNRLPTNPVSADTISSDACSPTEEGSRLIYQGKGGIPPLPTEPFSAEALIPDGKPITIDEESDLNSLLLEESETEQLDPYDIPEYIKPVKTDNGDIYPARGIIKTADGRIILTTYPTTDTTTRTPEKQQGCS